MLRKINVFVLLSLGWIITCAPAARADEKAATDELTVLARGPVHEAFAEPVLLESKQAVVVSKKPPEAIEEIPPNVRPAGKNVQWIPGYWGWEEQRDDFLWVSGIWRDAPPDQRWVPGYWSEVEDGYTWVSGFWVGEDVAQVEYLPDPPQSLEEGPQSPSPSESHFWVPGCWELRDGRYAWRPGYWQEGHEDWVWVPSRYSDSPSGSIYVAGYWDYDLPRRGILFSPVYYDTPVYNTAGYTYTPYYLVDLALITAHLFVHAGNRHYYYGDYYAAGYAKAGIHPWFEFHASKKGYDPIYAYRHWHEGRGRDEWNQQLKQRHQRLRENEAERPVGTLADSRLKAADRSRQLTRSIDSMLEDTETPLRVERLDDHKRQVARDNARQFRQFRNLRSEQELAQRSDLAAKAVPRHDPSGKMARGKDAKAVTAFKLPEGYQASTLELPKSQRVGQAPPDAETQRLRPSQKDIRVPDRPANERLGVSRRPESSPPPQDPRRTQTGQQQDPQSLVPTRRAKQQQRVEQPEPSSRRPPALPDQSQDQDARPPESGRQQKPDRGDVRERAKPPQRIEQGRPPQRDAQPKQPPPRQQPRRAEAGKSSRPPQQGGQKNPGKPRG